MLLSSALFPWTLLFQRVLRTNRHFLMQVCACIAIRRKRTAMKKNDYLCAAFIIATQYSNVAVLPHGRKLNEDKIVFVKYERVGLYCALNKTELSHLHGPSLMQSRIVYRIGGAVTRTRTGIAPMGIAVNTSWPGFSRL